MDNISRHLNDNVPPHVVLFSV